MVIQQKKNLRNSKQMGQAPYYKYKKFKRKVPLSIKQIKRFLSDTKHINTLLLKNLKNVKKTILLDKTIKSSNFLKKNNWLLKFRPKLQSYRYVKNENFFFTLPKKRRVKVYEKRSKKKKI